MFYISQVSSRVYYVTYEGIEIRITITKNRRIQNYKITLGYEGKNNIQKLNAIITELKNKNILDESQSLF